MKASETKEPDWLEFARDELARGVEEVPGPEANPRILWYDSATSLKATSDEVPWCSAFACACMEAMGYESPQSAAARSWLKWGQVLDAPRIGCIVVFSRGASPTAGHVGFVVGETEHTLDVLGGNQGDRVSIATFLKDHVLGYRWPAGQM